MHCNEHFIFLKEGSWLIGCILLCCVVQNGKFCSCFILFYFSGVVDVVDVDVV